MTSESGINLRSQIKPSVLQIHRFLEFANAPEPSANPEHDEVIPANTHIQQDVARVVSRNYEEPSALPSQCSYLRSLRCRSPSCSKITLQMLAVTKERTMSTISLKSPEASFFCEWKPVLFGIDEENIPSEEEEEVVGEDQEEIAEFEGEPERKPRFGRRSKPKPNLKRDDGKEFQCICDIDEEFERHHVPHFGGGIRSEKEQWRVPHFSSYWEDYKERLAAVEDASLMKLVAPRTEEETIEEKKRAVHPPFLRSFGRNVREARRRTLQSLRPLTCRELRRYRMNFSEAVILELQEDGYHETADFLKSLLIEEYQLDQGREKSPTIRESKPKLQKLIKLLTAAEKKGRKQEYNTESAILLKTGKHFSDSEPKWWWLADRLYERATEAASKYIIDGGKSEAIAHYIYGVFLLNNARKVHAAQEHLNKARELSSGREWNASRIIEKAQEPIHRECCNYLCRALIETSRQLRKEGKPEEALKFIHQSYKLCEESHSSKPEIELDTLFELGATYQDTGELEWAKTAFKKYIAKAKMEDSHRSICDGHLELAICYRMEGEINHCHYHLQCYLNHATANNDENLKAFGNRYLGEFLLNHGYSHEAIEYFEEAFKSFLEQCERMKAKPYQDWLPEELTLPQDVEMARVLTGLAKGEILTKPICRLILRARDVRNQKDTLKLLKWKNSQEISFELTEEEHPKQGFLLEPESTKSTSMGETLTSEESIATEGQEEADGEEP